MAGSGAPAISKEWDEATTDAAIETAGYVVAHVNDLAGTRDDAKDRGRQAARPSAARSPSGHSAGRLPRTDTRRIVDKQFDAAKNLDAGVKARRAPRAQIAAVSLSRNRASKGDSYRRGRPAVVRPVGFASRSANCCNEAKAGRLSKREEIAQQAERMLGDLRAKAKLHEFLLTWLKADQVRDLTKDTKKFPGFDAATIADLRTSLELFLDDVTGPTRRTFRELLLGRLPVHERAAGEVLRRRSCRRTPTSPR